MEWYTSVHFLKINPKKIILKEIKTWKPESLIYFSKKNNDSNSKDYKNVKRKSDFDQGEVSESTQN